MKTVPFLICLSFFILLACQHNKSRTADINSLFSLPEILSEVSGIVATDSLIWMIEDSGNKAVIYGLRSDGEITKTIELNHLNNLDWEDLTRDKEKNLYIGDFGNNNNDRKDLVIYKISTEKSINSIEKINFYYPEQTDFPAKKSEKLFDCEAFFLYQNYFYLFTKNRSKGFAYEPIIASGSNACVLHYIENNMQCKDGDVILLDVGAEYANYSSDLTRCIPVNGRFTERQKKVYNAVLSVKKQAEELLVPGTIMAEYHKEVGKFMEAELLGLGLIDQTDIKNQNPEWPAYKKYFMHGTSHFLGLDTHDVGIWHEPIKEGMVFTCEPGIYIPEEGLGIRLEDDLVVQSTGGPFNLMKDIPLEAAEIEDLMNS